MGLVYALPDFFDNSNIIKTSNGVQQLNGSNYIYYQKPLTLVKCQPVSGEVHERSDDVVVKTKKSKKGKKKKRRIVREEPSSAKNEENAFFSK